MEYSSVYLTPSLPPSPSLISHLDSVDVKQHVYLLPLYVRSSPSYCEEEEEEEEEVLVWICCSGDAGRGDRLAGSLAAVETGLCLEDLK